MSKSRKLVPKPPTELTVPGYDQVLCHVVDLLESARRAAARSVNAIITTTYWEIGRRIVEFEQGGKEQAEYGSALLKCLAVDLTNRFGRGFSWRNLYQMRGFYLAYPNILQTLSAISTEASSVDASIIQAPSEEFTEISAAGQTSAGRSRFSVPTPSVQDFCHSLWQIRLVCRTTRL